MGGIGDEEDRQEESPDFVSTGFKDRTQRLSIRNRIEEKYMYPRLFYWEKLGALPRHRFLIGEHLLPVSFGGKDTEFECNESLAGSQKLEPETRNVLMRSHPALALSEFTDLIRNPDQMLEAKIRGEFSGFASGSSRYHFREYMYQRMMIWLLCKSIEESKKITGTGRIPVEYPSSHKDRLFLYHAKFLQQEEPLTGIFDKNEDSPFRPKGYVLRGARTKDLLREWRLGKIRLTEKEELKIVEKEKAVEKEKDVEKEKVQEAVEKDTDAKNDKKKSGI